MPAVPIIGLGLTAASAISQRNAAKAATKAQTNAANDSIAEQRRQYDQTRADQLPWLTAGSNALAQMQQLNSGNFSSFTASPDYQFTLDQGIKGLDRSAAARGRLYSGGYGEDLTQYAQGLAAQQYGTYYNRLASMAGQGQVTATNLGTAGQNFANQYSNQRTNIGNARASGYQAQAGANQNLINGLGTFLGGVNWGGSGGGGSSMDSGANGVFQGASYGWGN